MIRLFVGLEIPAELRRRLGLLASGLPNARWVPGENLHITLRFIGEVDEDRAEELHDRLMEIDAPAFEVVLSGCGAFSDRHRAHSLWVGVERNPLLGHLRDKVESAAVRAGLPPDGRKYSPHVTLARLRDVPQGRLQDFMAGHNLLKERFEADRFVLFSSLLGHGDPVYAAEADYPLRKVGA